MAEEGMNKKKIMVAIDESDCSHYALNWALKNLGESIASSSPLMVFTAQPVVNLTHFYASSFGVTPLLDGRCFIGLGERIGGNWNYCAFP